MNKLKKFYVNNRIYCILMIISFCCLILIGATLVGYVISQNTKSEYGNRLDDIDDYEVDNDLKKMEDTLKSTDAVESSEVRLQGKIIYITVGVKEDTTKETVQNIANSMIEQLSDDNKTYYDVQFIFTRDNYDAYLGSKSSTNTVVSWTYTYDVEPNTTSNSEE